MELYQYKSYEQYIKKQIRGYKKKRDRIWAKKRNVRFMAHLIKAYVRPESGLCHGVRTGSEVLWFRKYLKCKMLGTEIGKAVKDYVVRWDFNEPKEEWIHAFDFVYTNSFDHSFSPNDTLRVWYDQLKPGGLMLIETSSKHEKVDKLDPFGATVEEICAIMSKWMKVDQFDLPVKRRKTQYSKILIGRKE